MSSTEMVEETPAPAVEPAQGEQRGLLDGLSESAQNRDEEGEIDELATLEHRSDPEAEEADDTTPLERPTFLPEKFWSEENGVELEKFSKSYAELERQFHAGEHKIPEEGYDLSKHKEKVSGDDPLLQLANDWGKQYQVPPAAFDDLITRVVDMGYETAEDAKQSYDAEMKALGPKGEEIVKQEHMFLDSLHRMGVLNDADLTEAETMLGTARSMDVFRKIKSAYGIGDAVIPSPSETSSSGVTQEEWRSMLGDKRYGTDDAFTRKADRLADQLFPGNAGTSATAYFDPAANM